MKFIKHLVFYFNSIHTSDKNASGKFVLRKNSLSHFLHTRMNITHILSKDNILEFVIVFRKLVFKIKRLIQYHVLLNIQTAHLHHKVNQGSNRRMATPDNSMFRQNNSC